MDITELLSVPSGAAWLPVVDAIAKATIVFATAGLLSVILRRASAASRHLIWTLALMSALALPLFSIAMPKWEVGLLTIASPQIPGDSVLPSARRLPTSGAEAEVSGGQCREPARRRTNREPRGASSDPAGSFLACNHLRRVAARRLRDSGQARCSDCSAVQWMSRRTERVTDAPWLPQARALAAELGISPRIIFLRSGRAAMPMAWGVFRPAVLMPSEADHLAGRAAADRAAPRARARQAP